MNEWSSLFPLLVMDSHRLVGALVVLSLLQVSSQLDTSDLIFGGQRAVLGQFPSQVLLSLKNAQNRTAMCGGSLLSPLHVLTAAHCSMNFYGASYAMLGMVTIGATGSQSRAIHSFTIHPNFTAAGAGFNDIAVVTLKEEVDLSDNVRIVKIAGDDEKLLRTTKATISGFGTYKFENGTGMTSRDLLYVEVDRVDQDWCTQRWANMTRAKIQLWDKQLCAGSDGKGSAPGDSGGPLQVKVGNEWIQLGLSSFGVKGAEASERQDEFPSCTLASPSIATSSRKRPPAILFVREFVR